MLKLPVRNGEEGTVVISVPMEDGKPVKSALAITDRLRRFGDMQLWRLPPSKAASPTCSLPVSSYQAWLKTEDLAIEDGGRRLRVMQGQCITIGRDEVIVRDVHSRSDGEGHYGIAIEFPKGVPSSLHEWDGQTVAVSLGGAVFGAPLRVSVSEEEMMLLGGLDETEALILNVLVSLQREPYRIDFPPAFISPELEAIGK